MEAGAASYARRHCFAEGDDGLASIVEMEAAGFSGSGTYKSHHPIFSRTVVPRRRGSIRNIVSLSSSGFAPTAGYGCSSPRSVRPYDARFEELNHPPHFLQACFLCKKPLGDNRDIFMYRGDTPFCSEECRQEQIDFDEAKEKKKNLSASVKAMRTKKNDASSTSSSSQKSPSSSPKSQDYYRASTVAAA